MTAVRRKVWSLFSCSNVFPPLRRIQAHLLGIGIRPEHIRTPEVRATA
jgi:hypothetical protein